MHISTISSQLLDFKEFMINLFDPLIKLETIKTIAWKKKKFILQTAWVITLDRLVNWLDADHWNQFLKESILQHLPNSKMA